MSIFYNPPHNAQPRRHGRWWLPGLGADQAPPPEVAIPLLAAMGAGPGGMKEALKELNADIASGKVILMDQVEVGNQEQAMSWGMAYLGPGGAMDHIPKAMLYAALKMKLDAGQTEIDGVKINPKLATHYPVPTELALAYRDGMKRYAKMLKEQEVVELERTPEAREFVMWWHSVCPATMAAMVAHGEPMKVPAGLYAFWQANPNATEVPDKLLGKGWSFWTKAAVIGGGALVVYLILDAMEEEPRYATTVRQM